MIPVILSKTHCEFFVKFFLIRRFQFDFQINLSSFYAQNLPEDNTPTENEEENDDDLEPINEDEFDDEIDIDNEENTEDLEPFDEALWDKEFGEEQDS